MAKKFSSIEPPSNIKPSKHLAGTNIKKFAQNTDGKNSKPVTHKTDSEDGKSLRSSANILCVSVQDEVDRENERLLAAEVRSSTQQRESNTSEYGQDRVQLKNIFKDGNEVEQKRKLEEGISKKSIVTFNLDQGSSNGSNA